MSWLVQIGDYAGTFVFAMSGAMAARRTKFDLGGCVVLGIVTGVGGGTIRDLIIFRGFVSWGRDPMYLSLCVVASVIAFLWVNRIVQRERALVMADAFGMSIYAVIGAGIAVENGARPMISVLMGVVTATGGGVIRDVLRNEVHIVSRGEIYATAALCGALIFVVINSLTSSWLC